MRIVIFRTGGSILDYKTYNCQELGLAKALADLGHEPYVIMAGGKYSCDVMKNDNGNSVTVFTLSFKGINQALSIFNGWKPLLENIRPDIIQVHEFGMLMSYKVVRWAKNKNIPTVLIQGTYETTRKPVFKNLEVMFNKTFGKYIIKNVSGIGCKTIKASEYVKSYYKKSTTLTPVGLDTGRFANSVDRDWKKDLHIEGKKILLYVGKLEQRRNPLFLVQVAKNLPSDYVMLLAGNGPLMDETKEQAKDCDRIIFLGKLTQQQLPSLYHQSDLFILASSYEIFGMVIMEAMYFGLPVISTDTAGAKTLISNWQDGIIEDNMNVNSWIEDICKLLSDNELYRNLAEQASRKAQDNFPWRYATLNYVDLYKSCISQN